MTAAQSLDLRNCSDFEVTVRYPARASAPPPSVFDGPDTQVGEPPSAILVHFSSPSESLIADAEAIVGAFRRERAPASWDQLSQGAPAAALVEIPGLPARRWYHRIGDAAQITARAVRDGATSVLHWVRASEPYRHHRRGRCPSCREHRALHDLSLELPTTSMPFELSAQAKTGDLSALERLEMARTSTKRLIVSIKRCSHCATHSTVDLVWVQGPWREVIAADIAVSDAEARSLLARQTPSAEAEPTLS